MNDVNHIRKETLRILRERTGDVGLSLASADVFCALYQDRTQKNVFASTSLSHTWHSALVRYGLLSQKTLQEPAALPYGLHAPLAHAIGSALAQKMNDEHNMTYCIMSHQDLRAHTLEELSSPHTHHLANVCCIILDNSSSLIPLSASLPQWNVIEVDGHNIEHITSALVEARNSSKPTAIVAHVISGKGVSFFEHTNHHRTITQHEHQKALREL